MANAFKYWYGDKPGGTQKIGTSYTRLENSKWDPGMAGWDNHLVYLNVDGVKGTGWLRLRAVRADGDATGYIDFWCKDGQSRLITHTYWESRGANDGATYWQVKCRGGLEQVTLETRYTKRCVVRK